LRKKKLDEEIFAHKTRREKINNNNKKMQEIVVVVESVDREGTRSYGIRRGHKKLLSRRRGVFFLMSKVLTGLLASYSLT
jgi:hypothetical protein